MMVSDEYSFFESISRYKHQGFKEENEVRIVCLPINMDEEFLNLCKEKEFTPSPEKERKNRQKNGKTVPYIELFESPDIVLPIERIIVGPHVDKEYRAAFLRVMLRKTDIKITVSEIPFID